MMEALWLAGMLAANLWAAGGLDSMFNTEQGAVTGGALGGLLGVTYPPRHYLAGAAIGGAAGAAVGDAVGAEREARDNRLQAQAIAAANAQALRQMSLEQIVEMGRASVPDAVIIRQIEGTRSVFNLAADDVQYLRGQKVSADVIAAMLAHRNPPPADNENDHRTPILPPIKYGEKADCVQVPSLGEVLRAFPAAAHHDGYIEFVSEKLVGRVDPPRYFPLIGPAQLHHCHWKCTVYFVETHGNWSKGRKEIVYIDKDHLHLCTADQTEATPEPAERCPYCPGGHQGPISPKQPPIPVEVQPDVRCPTTLPTPCELIGKRVLLETRTESGPPILSDIPYLSRLFRNVGWSRESVQILPPLKHGEESDCVNPPDEQEILRALPPLDRGVAPIYEIFRDDIEFTVEKLVDRIDPPRFFPLIGPAQLHHCHWKCTVYFTETTSVFYPLFLTANKRRAEVVYIDTDHLHLFAAEKTDAAPEPAERCPYCPGGHNGPAKGATPGNPSVRTEENQLDRDNLRRMHEEWRVSSAQSPLPPECGSRPPAHRVVAPDILVIESVRLVGKKPLGEDALKDICGEHLIRYDGTLSLGMYGSAYVAGMTVGQIKCVVEEHLIPYFVDPQVSVELKTNQRPVAQTGTTEESSAPPPNPQMAKQARQMQLDIIAAEVDPADFRQRAMKTGILSDATDFRTFLQQMQAKGKVKMLAQPRVTTWFGHEGWTQSGSDVELKLPAGVGMPPRICRMFVGTEIKFLAKLKDGKIELAVHAALSDPDEAPSGATGGFDAPGFHVRTLDADAVLNDGQTLLMVADDFPPAQSTKKATLFLVTPRLVSPIPQADNGEASTAPPPSQQMSLADIVRLSQHGIAEDIIVRQMELTESVFKLTVEDILSLHEQGVSDNLIRTIQLQQSTDRSPSSKGPPKTDWRQYYGSGAGSQTPYRIYGGVGPASSAID